MTRINLVPAKELADQHLMAEWREIKMVPAALRRSLKTNTWESIKKRIPRHFCLGSGHVLFFFDKMTYLDYRYVDLSVELISRGYRLNESTIFNTFTQGLPEACFGRYTPTETALNMIRDRINEKINMKPEWYRWTNYITA